MSILLAKIVKKIHIFFFKFELPIVLFNILNYNLNVIR